MSLFICPICGGELERNYSSLRCKNGHCYDISSEGYVNLLPANRKNSKAPGDDKGMAVARNTFLSAGYYDALLNKLQELAVEFSGPGVCMLDCGCGEGYYTSGIYQSLERSGKHPRAAGLDISKFILKKAAKREKSVEFAVASSYHMPVKSDSVDLLINCFSPLAVEEFKRVLRTDGVFLYVVPGKRHLFQLKEILYDEPYENEEKVILYDGFEYIGAEHIEKELCVSGKDDIHALFQMTPYYWKTPKAGSERLSQLDALDVTAQFNIHIFRKK